MSSQNNNDILPPLQHPFWFGFRTKGYRPDYYESFADYLRIEKQRKQDYINAQRKAYHNGTNKWWYAKK